jgi:hypothetical protein
MKEIQLTRGKVAIVDDADFEELNCHKWQFNPLGYAHRIVSLTKNKHKTCLGFYMHREIFFLQKGETIDHINGNKLDNRKENLRICTFQENSWNRKIPRNNKSGYKGVYWRKKENRWVAAIKKDNKVYYLGFFKEKISAAKAYNQGAKKYFGKFARLNIIP